MLDQEPILGLRTIITDSANDAEALWWRDRWIPLIAGGAEDDSDADEDEGEDGDGTETDDSDEDDDSEDTSKEKTLTQSQVNKLLAKERRKAARGKVDPKELGFETQKELDEFVKAQKAKSDEDKSKEEQEREKQLKDAIEAAEKGVLSKAHRVLLKAEFKSLAADAGIPRDRVDDAFALAQGLEDWDDISVNDKDEVEGLDEDFFTTLKEAKPYLFVEESDDDEDDEDDDTPTRISSGTRAKGGKTKATEESKLREAYPGLRQLGN